jgi:hypothetical protein
MTTDVDDEHFDPAARAAEKTAQRAEDERALASGDKTPAQIERDNSVFLPIARRARVVVVDVPRSRRRRR